MRISLFALLLFAATAFAQQQTKSDRPELRQEASSPAHQRLGFGIGSGLGQATGDAGSIYGTSSPMIDARLVYWPIENMAFLLGFQDAKHQYDIQPDGLTDVEFQRLLLQARYSLSAGKLAPQLIGGIGWYRRRDTVGVGNYYGYGGDSSSTSTLGFNAGFGFQYELIGSKAFLQLEGMAHFASYSDDLDPKFLSTAGIPKRNGAMLTAVASFVWAFL